MNARVRVRHESEHGVPVFRLGDGDRSPLHSTNPPAYDPECSLCWLGFAHTEEVHRASLAGSIHSEEV